MNIKAIKINKPKSLPTLALDMERFAKTSSPVVIHAPIFKKYIRNEDVVSFTNPKKRKREKREQYLEKKNKIISIIKSDIVKINYK